MTLLLLLLLLGLVARDGSGAETGTAVAEPSSVPVPTNVEIKSVNMNPFVYWNYETVPWTPIFIVQVKNYGVNEWTESCNSTSQHYCNIFKQVNDPANPLWARVKARIGQKESAYALSKEFILCHKDELGPPTVAATQKKDHVIIDVFHPLVIVNGKKLGTVYNAETDCHTIEYTVNVKVNGSEIPETKYKLKDDNCTETLCQLSIPASPLNSQYCVSAEGVSSAWGVKTNKSRELCFTISSSSQKGSIWIPIVAVFLVSLVFILIFVYCHLKKNSCKRKSIKLPKSLVSVVKCATSETKPESKYVSVITACEPFVLENEVLICEEPLSPAPVPSTDIQDNTGKVEGEEPLSTEIEVIPNESISDLAPGSPLTLRENSLHSSSNQSESCDITLNSYHTKNGSDSGLVGLDSFVSDSEILPSNKTEMNTGGQESATLRNAPTSFGYDKPHVMVDLLVGDDVKESLIGYRLTTDSSEFS